MARTKKLLKPSVASLKRQIEGLKIDLQGAEHRVELASSMNQNLMEERARQATELERLHGLLSEKNLQIFSQTKIREQLEQELAFQTEETRTFAEKSDRLGTLLKTFVKAVTD